MIPIKLVLQGVYSYQEKQTIDFTQLVQARLFGIFGSVGSGKSTILEAITYALYGNLDRMNAKGDDLSYNLMNLKSNELLIDFEFSMGNGEHYRFVVEGKRTKKDFLKVNLKRIAYENTQGEWKPLNTKTAESILGLSYDNFCRTIIIPQGKFSAFLQLGAKDRSQMLEDIFRLERFNLSANVRKLKTKNEEALHKIVGGLGQLEGISAEAIAEAQQQKKEVKQQLEALEKNFREKSEVYKQLEQIKQWNDEVTDKKLKLKTHQQKENEINALRQEIEDYGYCQQYLKPLDEERKSYTKEITKWEKELAGLISEKTKLKEAISKQELSFKQKQKDLANKDQIKEKINNLLLVIELKGLEEELVALDRKLNSQLADYKSSKEKVDMATQQEKQLRESIEALQLPDIMAIKKAENWWQQQTHFDSQLEKIQNEITQEQNHIDDIVKNKVPAIEKKIASLSFIDKSKKVSEGIAEGLAFLDSEIEQKQEDKNKLTVKKELATYAETLRTKGGECPICGATEHPHLLEDHQVNDSLKKIEQLLKELKTNKKSLQEYQTMIQGYGNQYQDLKERKAKLEESLKALQQEIAEHQKEQPALSADEAQQQNEVYTTLHKEKLEKEKKVKKLNLEKEALETALQTMETAKTTTEQAQLKLQTKIETLKEKLNKGFWLDNRNKAIEELQKLHDTEKQNYENLQEKFEETQKLLKKLEDSLVENQTQTALKQKDIEHYNASLLKIDTQWRKLLNERNFEDNYVLRLLSSNVNVSERQQAIEAYFQIKANLEQEITHLEEKLSQQATFDSALFESLKEEMAQLDTQKNQLTEQLGELNGKIQEVESKLKEKERLQKEKEQLDERQMNLATLDKMFKGNGFVNYISTVYLQNLCEQANERFFKLTHQQLRLEVDENNEFIVRDYLNEGKKRNIKTLSGGQIFQASLCLALALADNVMQQNQASQNFFFIDEGFGSQDKKTLQVVFDTLKSLQKENRIVGFISHVEELQQEISVHLKIERHPEKGSNITESW